MPSTRAPSQPMPSGGPDRRGQVDDRAVGQQQHRVRMTGRRPAEPPDARGPLRGVLLDPADQRRRHRRDGQADQRVVDPAQHLGRLLQPVEGDPPDQRLDLAHRRGGLDVVAHDVADDQHGVAVGLQERVVPVAADRHALRRRPVPDGELQVVGLDGRGEQAQLEPLGHLLVGRGEPGVVERERRPAGGDLRRPQLGLRVRARARAR